MTYQTIYDSYLLKKLAPKILSSEKNQIILQVIEELIKNHLISNMKFLVFLDRINEMSEEELDAVAEEMHIDFYDYTLSIEKKREACKSSFALHSIKGTSAAVKKVLNIFFRNSSLEQWYEYNGKPGRFRVKIDGKVPENLHEIAIKIEDAKKKSQHLEKIIFISKTKNTLYAGSHLIQGQKYNIKQSLFTASFKPTFIEVKTGLDCYIKQTERRK